MGRVQTTLSNHYHRDLKILAEYQGISVAGLARELIEEGLCNMRNNEDYYQKAKKHYQAMEKRWGPNFSKNRYS